MRLLVDTSAYSALRRGIESIVYELQSADEVFVNSIVLGELRAGFAYRAVTERNESELRAFLDLPRVKTIDIDDETSVFYAAIYASLRRAGTPVPSNGLWIAATAMQSAEVQSSGRVCSAAYSDGRRLGSVRAFWMKAVMPAL